MFWKEYQYTATDIFPHYTRKGVDHAAQTQTFPFPSNRETGLILLQMKSMFTGSLVAIITPMKSGVRADTPLDMESMARLLEYHIEQNTDGVVIVGTTGESATLMPEEHCQVIKQVVDIVAKRIPVIAGTGANSTIEAMELTAYAKQAGADACLLVTPYYNKPTQVGLYEHFKTVAGSVSIPQILYNVPGRTACDMLPETVSRLSRIDNIIGIKEATGSLDRVKTIREDCGDDFLLLSGDDETACDFMLLGGDGVISVTANVAPAAMSELCRLAIAGERNAAKALDAKLLGLHQSLFLESNPIPAKWAAQRLGLVEDGIRLPMTWLSEEYRAEVEAAMKQAEVLL